MNGGEIEVRPIANALGAEIHGIDLSRELDDATFTAVRQALHDHLVIFFRDQKITPYQHLAFGRRFGEVETYAYAKGLASHPEILPVIKEAEDRSTGVFGTAMLLPQNTAHGQIYTPWMYLKRADTQFSSTGSALRNASNTMKDLLSDMKAVHTGNDHMGPAIAK